MLSCLNSVYRFIWPIVTYEWCMKGMGKRWEAELCKCYNGVPAGSGFFLTYVKFKSEEDCCRAVSEINEIIRNDANPHAAWIESHV